jgi:hypothetical protein
MYSVRHGSTIADFHFADNVLIVNVALFSRSSRELGTEGLTGREYPHKTLQT